MARTARQRFTNHDAGLRPRIRVLKRGHSRDDLDVSLQGLIDEMKLVGRPPDVVAARRHGEGSTRRRRRPCKRRDCRGPGWSTAPEAWSWPAPALTWRLVNVAVERAESMRLVTASPTYAAAVMLTVVVPAVVQDVPFAEKYPVNWLPCRTSRNQTGAAPARPVVPRR